MTERCSSRAAAPWLYKISELMGNRSEIRRRHYAALIPEQMRDTMEFDRRVRTPTLRMA